MFQTVALIATSRNWIIKLIFFSCRIWWLHLSFCDITECLHSLVFMYSDPIIADVQVLVLMVYFNQIGGREASLTSLGIFFIRIFICSSISALFCVTTNSSDRTYFPLLPPFSSHPSPSILPHPFIVLPSPLPPRLSSFSSLLFSPPSRSELRFPRDLPELTASKCQCFTLLTH